MSLPFVYWRGAQDSLALVNLHGLDLNAEAFYIGGFEHFVRQKSTFSHKRRGEFNVFLSVTYL